MKTYMSNILRLLLDYVNYLDLSDEYLIDLKYLIKKEFYIIKSEYFDFNEVNKEFKIFREAMKQKFEIFNLKEDDVKYLNKLMDLFKSLDDKDRQTLYIKVKNSCDVYFKRKTSKNSLTRRELVEILMKDKDRLDEEIYLYDMEDGEYYPLSETSSEYLDIIKQNNKEKFVSFTEEGMRFSNKNKIGQKRVTILN